MDNPPGPLDPAPPPPGRRDRLIPTLILVFTLFEVLLLWTLFAFDTPLSPWARGLSWTFEGTVLLALCVVWAITSGVAVAMAVLQRRRKPDDSKTG